MVEIYAEKGCIACIRSSPVASLLGFIMILFGIGAFSGGFIIFWNLLQIKTDIQVEYIIYGIVLSVVIYVILCYILAALSSGYNRKRFFEGSKKAKIGRCFTLFNIICLMLNSFIWILVSCISAYCLIITGLLKHRNTLNKTIDLTYYVPISNASNTNEVLGPRMLLSVSFTFGGSLAVVFGFMQLLCCSAMNYVRLSEERYYDNNSLTQDKSDHVLSAF